MALKQISASKVLSKVWETQASSQESHLVKPELTFGASDTKMRPTLMHDFLEHLASTKQVKRNCRWIMLVQRKDTLQVDGFIDESLWIFASVSLSQSLLPICNLGNLSFKNVYVRDAYA